MRMLKRGLEKRSPFARKSAGDAEMLQTLSTSAKPEAQ